MYGLTRQQQEEVFRKVEREYLEEDFNFYLQSELGSYVGIYFDRKVVNDLLDMVDYDYLCNKYEDEYSVSIAKEDIICDIVVDYVDKLIEKYNEEVVD